MANDTHPYDVVEWRRRVQSVPNYLRRFGGSDRWLDENKRVCLSAKGILLRFDVSPQIPVPRTGTDCFGRPCHLLRNTGRMMPKHLPWWARIPKAEDLREAARTHRVWTLHSPEDRTAAVKVDAQRLYLALSVLPVAAIFIGSKFDPVYIVSPCGDCRLEAIT